MDAAVAALLQADSDRRATQLALRAIVSAARQAPCPEADLPRVLDALKAQLASRQPEVRAGVYRALRYLMTSERVLEEFVMRSLTVFVVRSLELPGDNRFLWERMQALKLVRQVTSVAPARAVPRALVRSLVAVSAHRDDSFRRVCLETLRELAVSATEAVARCDGFKTLFDAILDPQCQELAQGLVLTVLFVLNDPRTRAFVRPHLDLQLLLSTLTDMDAAPGPDRRQRWEASQLAIITMLRSWPGILLLAADPHGLRSLTTLLSMHVSPAVQSAVLQTVRRTLAVIEAPKEPGSDGEGGSARRESDAAGEKKSKGKGKNKSKGGKNKGGTEPSEDDDEDENDVIDPRTGVIDGARLRVPRHESAAAAALSRDANQGAPGQQPNLLDNYVAVVLAAFLHCGLVEGLVEVAVGARRASLAREAAQLLVLVLRLTARLLPPRAWRQTLLLQPLVEMAADSGARARAARAEAVLRAVTAAVGSGVDAVRPAVSFSNGVRLTAELLAGVHSGGVRTRREIVRDINCNVRSRVDEASLKELLARSCVLMTKDWTKWNWDVVAEALQGPLVNPARMAEALRTKFIKRLAGFFRCDPGDKGFFARLQWIPDHAPYVQIASQMYALLLETPDGVAFLRSDRRGQLFAEITAALEAEGSAADPATNRVFSPDCVSRQYFALLGGLSSSGAGLQLLEGYGLFQKVTPMGRRHTHDYLSRLLITSLDFSVDGAARVLLHMWITEGSRELRLFCTSYMRALLRADVRDFSRWGVELLITLLNTEPEVAEVALSVLIEAAHQPKHLSVLIATPLGSIDHLPHADSLLLRFLRDPAGFAFLRRVEWVDKALARWRDREHRAYVHSVEQALIAGLHAGGESGGGGGGEAAAPSSPDDDAHASADPAPTPVPVPVPAHAAEACVTPGYSVPLQWLYRMPWSVRVQIVDPRTGTAQSVAVDAFLDASQLRPEVRDDHSLASAVRVRALVLNSRHLPGAVQVFEHQTVQAVLMLGDCVVDRRGASHPAPHYNGGFPSVAAGADGGADALHGHHGHSHEPARTSRLRSWSTARSNSDAPPNNAEPAAAVDSEDEDGDDDEQRVGSGRFRAATEDALARADWSKCTPEARRKGAGRSTLVVPGGRAVWRFSTPLEEGAGAQLVAVEFVLRLTPRRAPAAPILPHLFGELPRTEAGCRLLAEGNDVAVFSTFALSDDVSSLDRRAALWALGHVGSSDGGFAALPEGLVGSIVALAQGAPALSLRGTCYYVLSLFSRSGRGRAALAALGWGCPATDASVVLPTDVAQLFHLPPSDYVGSPAAAVDDEATAASAIPLVPMRPEWRPILKHVAALSNHISQKEAHGALVKLKGSEPFSQLGLLLHVHRLFEAYKFRLLARRFVLDLFDPACLAPAAWDALSADGAGVGVEPGVGSPAVAGGVMMAPVSED